MGLRTWIYKKTGINLKGKYFNKNGKFSKKNDLIKYKLPYEYKNSQQCDHEIVFGEWASKTNLVINFPNYNDNMITSWKIGTDLGDIINSAMMEAEYIFAHNLIRDLRDREIPGVIVEFGVYNGNWLKHLSDSVEELKFECSIVGFDSFEGLPEPISGIDLIGFSGGDFQADFSKVYNFLECDKRKITLVKGWFCDSLKTEFAQSIQEICYARIDCDLYEGAKDCLAYLTDRLVDGAVLVFDDWSHVMNVGESRAFLEWAPTSGLKFEFLALNGWVHLYLRVRRD